jgi:hypothetical protein
MTNNASPDASHVEFLSLASNIGSRTRSVTAIDVRTLAAGTQVAMDTANSHYRFVILDEGGRRALVHGGRYFDGEAEARIEGSALGGTLLWVGWIGEGLCLELAVQGKRVSTSPVRSIAITTAPSGLRSTGDGHHATTVSRTAGFLPISGGGGFRPSWQHQSSGISLTVGRSGAFAPLPTPPAGIPAGVYSPGRPTIRQGCRNHRIREHTSGNSFAPVRPWRMRDESFCGWCSGNHRRAT